MRKPATRKASLKRTKARTSNRKKSAMPNFKWVYIALAVVLLSGTVYHYRNGLLYYFGYKTDKVLKKDKHLSDVRNFQLLKNHPNSVVGIDVSQYQGKIDWSEVDSIGNLRKIEFVFIRATMGNNKVDRRFNQNWREAKDHNFMRGAYHYYRPNENSLEQAKNFIDAVSLEKGDFPPVLDIEEIPSQQSVDSLKIGLRRWLVAVEKHYKVRPIIYSGERYYTDFLRDEFKGYIFWIANYNFFVENIKDEWTFWQFTDKGTVSGINGDVDVNIYNGTPKMLRYLAQ